MAKTKQKIDKMGVLVLMAHLVITLAFILIYAYTVVNGHEDETIKTILMVIVGYWFGAIGKDALTGFGLNKNQTKGDK